MRSMGRVGGRGSNRAVARSNVIADAPPHLPIADAMGPFLSPRGEVKVYARAHAAALARAWASWNSATKSASVPAAIAARRPAIRSW
jgi:hypothetical protein